MNSISGKPLRLSKGQQLRQALTRVAIRAQDRVDRGLPIRAYEDAIRRAMNKKVEDDPRVAWR